MAANSSTSSKYANGAGESINEQLGSMAANGVASHMASSSHVTSSPPVNGSQMPTQVELGLGAQQVAEATKNPELMQRMIESALDTVTVEDVNRQRENLNGAQGKKVMAALKKQGIKPAQLRKQILNSKSAQGREIHRIMQQEPLVIILRSGKVLSKHVTAGMEEKFIENTTGSVPILSPCTLLSSDNNTIFVCSETSGKINKSATRLVGRDVRGDVLIGRKEGDLTLDAFAELEAASLRREQ